MSVAVEEVTPSNREAYERYVRNHPESTFCDAPGWGRVIDEIYGLPRFRFLATEGGSTSGILALTLTRHPLFGRYLTTAPFANQGGFYADSAASAVQLLARADRLREESGASYVLVRHLEGSWTPPAGWVQDPLYSTYALPLVPDPEAFYRGHLRAKERNQIGKSLTHGFSVRFGRSELLDPFWFAISRSMRELGSPYHSRRYLESVLSQDEPAAELAVVFDRNGRVAGGSLLCSYRDEVVQVHANCLEKYRHQQVGDFLYWSVIAECCRRGARSLDMGRSLVGSGNEHFKLKWRPEKKPLAYWYRLSEGRDLPRLNQDNPRFRRAIQVWQRLPLWLLRFLGPRLISGIL